jgi:S1-C subfamily serine protease
MRDREPRRRPDRPNADETEPAAGPDPDQPRLGVSLGFSENEGAVVDRVEEDSPALKAGLKSGDVIIKINGEGIADGEALVSQVIKRKPGDEITLTVERGDETLELKTTLVAAKELKKE